MNQEKFDKKFENKVDKVYDMRICNSLEEVLKSDITEVFFDRILMNFNKYNNTYFVEILRVLQNEWILTIQEKNDFESLLEDRLFRAELEKWYNIADKVKLFKDFNIEWFLYFLKDKLYESVKKYEFEISENEFNEENIWLSPSGEMLYLKENWKLELLERETILNSDDLVVLKRQDWNKWVYSFSKNSLITWWRYDILRKNNVSQTHSKNFYFYSLSQGWEKRKIIILDENWYQKRLDIDSWEEIWSHSEILSDPFLTEDKMVYKGFEQSKKKQAFFDRSTWEQITDWFSNIELIPISIPKNFYISNRYIITEDRKQNIYDSQRNKIISQRVNSIEKVFSNKKYLRILVRERANKYYFIDVENWEQISQDFYFEKFDKISADIVDGVWRFLFTKINLKNLYVDSFFYDLESGDFLSNLSGIPSLPESFSKKLIRKGLNKDSKNTIVFGFFDTTSYIFKIIDWETWKILAEKFCFVKWKDNEKALKKLLKKDENWYFYIKKFWNEIYL